MLRILQNTHIDFIRLQKIAAAVIAAFIVPALVWMAISGFKVSVEFTGGTLVQLDFKQAPDVGVVRSVLAGAGVHGAEISTFGAANELVVRAQDESAVAAQQGGATTVAARIRGALDQRFGRDAYRVVAVEAVGPRVGGELSRNAAIAMFISFAATLIYLAWRFEWRLALASVLANVHDIVATFAFIKYLDIEITLFVIGGILTVIGYSLADKVVVFDRVRELRRTKDADRTPMYDTLNRAVNETLPRTVMTGSTVLACLLALIVFGGAVLRPFALVLLFGIIVGTFSSIYVAGPILLWIEKRWPRTATSSSRSGAPRPAAPRTGDRANERASERPVGVR